MKPLIGIPAFARVEPHGRFYDMSYQPNAHAVEHAGGLPIIIPSGLDVQTLRAIYERVDAVLLPGGGDIDPFFYNAETHEKTTRIDRSRDETDISVARWAYDDDRPLLGICRGHQVINVALGGTLIQDIPSLIQTDLIHDFPRERPRGEIAHDIKVDPSSKLSDILGATEVKVNSLHHQTIETPSPLVRITATAPDGVIESFEAPGKHFIIGVQWHPEDMVHNHEIMRNIFKSLVEAARDRAMKRGYYADETVQSAD